MSTGLVAKTGVETFGTVGVAMITPFDRDGAVDIAKGVELATRLVDNGCDSLVLAGTTGESPTTTTSEKLDLLKEVKKEVGSRARIMAGAGTNNTASTIELARASAEAGADSLLVVTPYYSKPSQEGLVQHFTAVAGATDLPVCLYDIPGRSGIPLTADTLRTLSELPTVTAVKDAKGDLAEAGQLISETGMAWLSGEDSLNLAWLALGATGVISVIGHLAPRALREMHDAVDRGDLERAREINSTTVLPLTRAQARLGGATLAKAGLHLQGIEVGAPRLPVTAATDAQLEELRDDMTQAGVL
ncbi:4-hydroxy-tetrahydrodipicolinate synthase [Corynebacterium incognita]|uniref:4-hydroxy-tetrahydrodipicolinate synthase n=1 Tax=Corynebacterium incognita TaxID=2754725 RepID=A0A7G7CQ69_9CORY|nr:4-hydroxy-tetrahydrodipicolinate synthase [Corynebacterium incognita]QNE89735.1 4-hydroxy-tetrahydrodipicolinate synthase [Corynebacterium incognita]